MFVISVSKVRSKNSYRELYTVHEGLELWYCNHRANWKYKFNVKAAGPHFQVSFQVTHLWESKQILNYSQNFGWSSKVVRSVLGDPIINIFSILITPRTTCKGTFSCKNNLIHPALSLERLKSQDHPKLWLIWKTSEWSLGAFRTKLLPPYKISVDSCIFLNFVNLQRS